jgi:hypothetical protein
MDKLAAAVVFAASYIDQRSGAADATDLRPETKALEYMSYLLQGCSDPELDALAARQTSPCRRVGDWRPG